MQETKDLQEIYNNILTLVKKYEPEMKVEYEYGSRYALAAKGEYDVRSERTGKKSIKKEPQFVAVIIQSNYVGFYNTAVYIQPDLFSRKIYWSNFKNNLKGKSCFHIKVWNDDVKIVLKDILKESYDYYKKNGWLGD